MFSSFSKEDINSNGKFYSPLILKDSIDVKAILKRNDNISFLNKKSEENQIGQTNFKSHFKIGNIPLGNLNDKIRSFSFSQEISSELTFQSSILMSAKNDNENKKRNCFLGRGRRKSKMLKNKQENSDFINENYSPNKKKNFIGSIDNKNCFNINDNKKTKFNKTILNKQHNSNNSSHSNEKSFSFKPFNCNTYLINNFSSLQNNPSSEEDKLYNPKILNPSKPIKFFESKNFLQEDNSIYKINSFKEKKNNINFKKNKINKKKYYSNQSEKENIEENIILKRDKNMTLKNICVCKVFYNIFSFLYRKNPEIIRNNKRGINRINKFIHYENIAESKDRYSFLFNSNFQPIKYENYERFDEIKNLKKTDIENEKNFFIIDIHNQIKNLSIDFISNNLSFNEIKLFLHSFEKYDLQIRDIPIIKIDDYGNSDSNSIINIDRKDYINFINYKENKVSEIKKNISTNEIKTQNVKDRIFLICKQTQNININDDSEFDRNSNNLTDKKKYSPFLVYKSHKKEFLSSFSCQICLRKFFSSCALGGHMSRRHANSSIKYKIKCEIRNKRENFRKRIENGRKLFCEKFNINYDHLNKTSEGRRKIRKLIKEKNTLYRETIKEIKSLIN